MSQPAISQGSVRPGHVNLLLEDLTLASPSSSISAARELLLEYGRFVNSQAADAGFCYGALEEEATSLPVSYLAQQGGAILASGLTPSSPEREGLGFVAWRTLPSPKLANAFEVKRLWVQPEARGLQLGRTLMLSVIDRAKLAGKKQLLLDTVPSAMTRAYRLYLDMGFIESPSYQPRATPGVIYMRKQL